MADFRALEGLKLLHGELLSVREHRLDGLQKLEQLLEAHIEAFNTFLAKAPRSSTSRTAVQSGKIKIEGDEYSVNQDFINDTLKLADELDVDELEAARVLLDANAEGDQDKAYGRPLWECGIMRFHQEREYVLDSMRLCIEIANDEETDPNLQDTFGSIVQDKIFGIAVPGVQRQGPAERFIPKCMKAMQDIKTWLQLLGDRNAAQAVLAQPNQVKQPESQEMYEFSSLSLIQQHELLAVILCAAVEKRNAEAKDFEGFLGLLRKADKYDHLLIHLFPALGEYITVFGSTEGNRDIQQARQLNDKICTRADSNTWLISNLGAAVRAWWIAEYSGCYLDDAVDLPNVNLDEEDEQRTKQFVEALKDGAFDFILAVAADCKAQDWRDPSKLGVRQWLQRKSPALMGSDQFPFASFFQRSLMMHLEVLVDASITNIPDILRKLRTDEDEQRQLSQTHEQDLDLERFLIIIAYAYEGRPDAAMSFWEDPDSNLAGFLQWASKRASTPLVSAFCEMLQALSDSEECATAAHMFLLDEGHHASGKMKRSQCLTWSQIYKELDFFTAKIRERPSPAQSHMHRLGKPSNELAETEPESAMMLECYLRLIAKLATESEVARQKLLVTDNYHLNDTLFLLAEANIPPRLRACVFSALKAFLTGKDGSVNAFIWRCFDQYMTIGFPQPTSAHRGALVAQNQTPYARMSGLFESMSFGFEEPNAVIQFLISLFVPVEGIEQLNDTLPFPEDLSAQIRIPGVEAYVDYVLGIFTATTTSKDKPEFAQLRMLRLSCLDFVMTCLANFNEDLIILGNQTNISIDQAISTSDLAAYIHLHPFARVMEWMYDDKVVKALINTIHQDANTLGSASPDSPLVLSILRAVEVLLKVLDLQATYLDLVRPIIRAQGTPRLGSKAHGAYSSFEDGIMNHLTLVVDLGKYCGIRHPPLTLACLKLLERISTSPKIISAWGPDAGLRGHRNKAIVQLEKDGEGEAIAASLSAEISETLDPILEGETQNYMIKIFILDFLYECLKATPDQPTIAHLLLGFHCEFNTLTIEPRSPFDEQKSLFHNLLNVFIGLSVFQEEGGVRGYLVTLKHRVLRVFQILWSSPLSSGLVMEELRATNFAFHTLLHEIQLQPSLKWDGLETANPEFLLAEASVSYIDFLSTRAMAFQYIGKELCSVSQNRIPTTKRQIFDALNGQMKDESNEPINIPNIFDFFDFLSLEDQWEIPPPQFSYYKDLDLSACAREDAVAGLQYDIHKVQEVLWLKRNESRYAGELIPQEQMAAIEREEAILKEYIVYSNRHKQFGAQRLKLLKSWTDLLLVMFEANDFKGTPKMAFLLQALQAILPSLEAFGSLSITESYELARVARVLLFKLDFSDAAIPSGSLDKESVTIGNLISDKLFQLFQVCLNCIGRWTGSAELRALYYSICYRYLTGVVDKNINSPNNQRIATSRQRTLKTIMAAGERLLNVICDDAYGSDTNCQTAAMILLGALVHIGSADDDAAVIDTLNRLNFIGVLVDSLKSILVDWLLIIKEGNTSAEQYALAKLALLLQLCQTRPGAKFVLQANLFRALEFSGVFAADPELEIDARNTRALEKHYGLLVSLARIVGAAVLSRGEHNVLQGRRFLQQHRMLLVHTLKRSAGIGTVGNGAGAAVNGRSTYGVHGGRDSILAGGGDPEAQAKLEGRIEELAEAFMLLITATGFLEFEKDQVPAEKPRPSSTRLFH